MNKDKSLFKNKVQMIIYLIIFCILIWAFIYLGTRNYKNEINNDKERFDMDFSLVDKDNVFVYAKNLDVRSAIQSGNTIVFFGNNKSEWVNYYASILNEAAKNVGIKKILYYDFFDDRDTKNGTYEKIVEILKDYVKTNDLGVKNIYAPTLVVIKNNNILYFDDETSFVDGDTTPNYYWTVNNKELKQGELENIFIKYLGSDISGS